MFRPCRYVRWYIHTNQLKFSTWLNTLNGKYNWLYSHFGWKLTRRLFTKNGKREKIKKRDCLFYSSRDWDWYVRRDFIQNSNTNQLHASYTRFFNLTSLSIIRVNHHFCIAVNFYLVWVHGEEKLNLLTIFGLTRNRLRKSYEQSKKNAITDQRPPFIFRTISFSPWCISITPWAYIWGSNNHMNKFSEVHARDLYVIMPYASNSV